MIGMIVVSAILTIALFNILIDPYDIFGLKLTELKRPLYLVDKSYLTKAVGLIHYKTDTIIIGTSIVDAAFKLPGSMTLFYEGGFHEKMHQLQSHIKPEVNIYNAGIRGGGITDIYIYIQHAYKNNPKLKHIIIGLEWNLFTYLKKPDLTVPVTPPLGKTFVPFTFYVNNALSWQVTYDSIIVMLNLIKINYGIDVIDIYKNSKWLKNLAYNWSRNDLSHQFTAQPIAYNDVTKHLVQSQNSAEMACLLQSIWFASNYKETLEKLGSAILKPEAFDVLRHILAFARANNITLDIYVSPQHGVFWETLTKYGFQPYIDSWLKQLVQITPYWDFSEKIDFSDNVSNYFDTDALHFNYHAAEIILPTIVNGQNHLNPGTRYVTIENINSMIQKRHQAEWNWLQHNRYMRDILNHPNFTNTKTIFGDLDKLQKYQPIVEYRPSFKGYQIIKFMDKFVALPENQSPYDFRSLFTEKYSNAIEGNSVNDLVSKINKFYVPHSMQNQT